MALSRTNFLLIAAIVSFGAFALLGIPRAEAVQASLVRIQLSDNHCTGGSGTVRGNPSGDNVWSSWASDSDDWDPDCVRLDLDSTLAHQTDIRFCIQTDDDGGAFGFGGGVSSVECTPWASDGGGWSAWAADPDAWAYDRIHIKVDTRGLSGQYVANYRLGFQNTRATGDNCGSGVGDAVYTPYMSSGGGWSSWAPDGENEGSIACSRIRLSAPTVLGLPCSFNGDTIASGGSVTAYAASSVPYGSSCASQTRVCSSGSLSGSYAYSSCSVSPQTPAPTGVSASCTAGNISMSWNAYSGATYYPRIGTLFSCPSGWSLSGGTTCYMDAYGPTSASITAPTNASYTFWVHQYTASGGMSNQTSVGVSCAAQNCTLDGTTVNHGSTVTAYQASSVPYGSTCTSQSRLCNNGTLSGSYAYSSCTVAPGANCTLNGVTVPHGSSYTFYSEDPVPYGTVCGAGNSPYAQSRTCTNGTLSGSSSFTYGTCSVDASQQPVSITGNGLTGSVTVRSGSSVKLQWDGVNADSCTLTGAGGFVSTSTPTVPMVSGSVAGSTWVQVNQKTTFTITCNKSSPASSSTQTATINMVPSVQEI